ncbi:hypothetical protein EV127DRAFT_495163 [Xylaria flabelliformis]|nr:hypothetical protein EV127DRAFT_495163 [Xylaria flabelliformis]
MSQLFAIMRRESQPDDSRSGHFRVVRHDVFKFVNNELIEQEGLSTAMRPKAVAHSEDLTYLLNRLYDSQYLDTFHDMQMVLNLSLYMCLLVDTCGRGGELAWNTTRPKHMHLKWEDVEFFTFQCAEVPWSIDIRANITIRQVTAETRKFLMKHGPLSKALKIDPVPMPEAQDDPSLEDMGMMDPGLIDDDILYYSD